MGRGGSPDTLKFVKAPSVGRPRASQAAYDVDEFASKLETSRS